MALTGLMLIGIAMTAPASVAKPNENGKAYGWNRNHATTTLEVAALGGPYDPFDVGEPSENGNGGGNAVGKPCAGCVGNADDKNPPGQLPGGHDQNNGYECDGNNGIGKTNPAHSSCEPTTSTTAATTTSTTAASTTTTAPPTTTTVAPTTTTQEATTTTAGAAVLGQQFTRDAALAGTGASALSPLVALGLLLLVTGVTLVVAPQNRRRAALN